jgi:benzil reductase ((S)-benzoin forming)
MDHLVIVTGGSAGLGHALLATAPADAHRVTVSRRPADDVARGHLEADLADPASWARVGDVIDAVATEREWERITCIQSAGTLEPIGFAGEVDPERYQTNVLLNAAAPQVLGHRFLAAVSHLRCRRELVMVSSGAARSDYQGWSSYGAAKAALDRWVSTVGAEQRQRGGVRVLSITPGVVATAMQERIRATDARDFPQVERFRGLHDEGQLADPDAVARRFWAVLDDDEVASGTVLDLRDHEG